MPHAHTMAIWLSNSNCWICALHLKHGLALSEQSAAAPTILLQHTPFNGPLPCGTALQGAQCSNGRLPAADKREAANKCHLSVLEGWLQRQRQLHAIMMIKVLCAPV
jgi:hypothetical protein